MIIPFSNGIGPFYDTFFGNLGKNPVEVGTHLVTHPRRGGRSRDRSRSRVTTTGRCSRRWRSCRCWRCPSLLIGGPMLAVNMFSSFPYTREIRYHYSSLVLVGIILATVEADRVRGGRSGPARARFLVGLVLATSVRGHRRVGAVADRHEVPLRDLAAAGRPPGAEAGGGRPGARRRAHERDLQPAPAPRAPRRRSTTSRCRGATSTGESDGEHLDDPAGVQWIVVDRRILAERRCRSLLDAGSCSASSGWCPTATTSVVARRVHPPPRTRADGARLSPSSRSTRSRRRGAGRAPRRGRSRCW